MSIKKMQFRCNPRGTTQFSYESIDKNLLYQNPLVPKRNRCTIAKIIPIKLAIFPLRTAIVLVANTHAQVSQTRTRRREKWIFPVGFPRFPP
jgi:hypothetical protein